MGYYTRYELEIVSGDDYVTDYAEEISEASNYNDCFDDDIKWYDYANEMTEYSKKHPDTLFKILGYGEGDGEPDVWEHYFKNGKSHKIQGKIVFEEFKIEELSKY